MRSKLSDVGFLALALVLFPASDGALSKDRALDSYEFKILLKPDLFAGKPGKASTVNSVWKNEISGKLAKLTSADVAEAPFVMNKKRRIRFWDTDGVDRCYLSKNDFILRERTRIKKDGDAKPKVTLKFRSPDPSRAAVVRYDLKGKKSEEKFEEDIGLKERNPPKLTAVFSASGKVQLKNGRIDSLDKVRDMFPGFEKSLPDVRHRDTRLVTVSNLTIMEYVFKGPTLALGFLEASTAVSVWYDANDESAPRPLLAELSFGYDRGKQVPADLNAARAVGKAALVKLASLLPATSSTKTKFTYSYKKFCKAE